MDNERMFINENVTQFNMKISSLRDMCIGKKLSGDYVVVGTGPAGLFCALALAYSGAKPIVFERGEKVEERSKSVRTFFDTLVLKSNSNVQFGEGGAGTFSDGKLNTNLHNEYVSVVLNEFVKFGAPKEITYLNKPHVGTDNLVEVVKNMRKEIIALGGEVHFNEQVVDIEIKNSHVTSVTTPKNKYPCKGAFFAIGHSARDTFEMLHHKGVLMTTKTFSMGTRIEHLRNEIDRAQYGKNAKISSADYKLATREDTGRSLYTFCMCPGGKVINASSEEGAVCVNGMSYFARDDVNSNSAILVNVDEKDWGSDHPLSGMEFQRKYERKAYSLSGGYKPIVQLYGDFCANRVSKNLGRIEPSVESGYVYGNINDCLPRAVAETIKRGVKSFGKKIKGFDSEDAVLTGIETRSSSPIRILRDENFNSNVQGLIPIGEGAGYAGGIVSASIDGIRSVLENCLL